MNPFPIVRNGLLRFLLPLVLASTAVLGNPGSPSCDPAFARRPAISGIGVLAAAEIDDEDLHVAAPLSREDEGAADRDGGSQDEGSDGGDDEKTGGCILRTPLGEVPEDPYRVSEVVPATPYPPFTKMLNACGIVLVAADDVPDLFLQLVGETVGEIFRPQDSSDPAAQREVLEHMHRYRALLPVPRTEASLERLFRKDPGAMDRVMDQNSVCDIIMAQVPDGQVMEVVEHILHAVTDVGLHYRFPEQWGISRDSRLWKAMHEAIEKGYYKIESYDDMREDVPPEIYERILLQEFAYWFISTAWDLQEDYGPDEDEWTIRTPAELEEKLPDFFAVYERTAGRVMQAPSLSTLAEFGPTRREEREGGSR